MQYNHSASQMNSSNMTHQGYDNDSFILGPQGCSSHASSEKKNVFLVQILTVPDKPDGCCSDA